MIRLRTLGVLDLRDADGRELRGVLAQPKRAALLVYLALATPRGPRRRDTLLALFWPEHDAEHARNALSQSVHFLRRALGPDALVNGSGDELSLGRSDFWCDAVAFEEALDAARSAEALDLYRGELLEGFHVANAPDFERWVEDERSRLGGRFVRAVEEAAAERQDAGDFAGSVACWRRLAARDPYVSRSALGLMRAMAAAGDPAGAVRHARVHEMLLREELGVAPDPEVAALVRQLEHAPREQPRPTVRAVPVSAKGLSVSGESLDTVEASPIVSAAVVSPPIETSERARPLSPASPRHERRRRVAILAGGLLAVCAASVAFVTMEPMLSASLSPVRSIAVLPFENLSGNPADQVFADGMHDALVSELGRYPELNVTSRTSVVHYKGTTKRLPDIARELNVDGVVEGALLREGGRIRLNAKLVRGSSDRHLWGQTYNRDLRDMLSLQAELAAAIASEVHVATSPPGRANRQASGARDSAPDELYLRDLYNRGRHAEVSRSPVGMENATRYYRLGIERDSSFALGYAGLSEAYTLLAHYDFAPKGIALDSARTLARRAFALDSTLPEVRTALAISLTNDGKFVEAEREFLRAIDLGPSYPAAHYMYGMLLVGLGRGAEALEHADIALRLDPLGPRTVLSTKRFAEYLISGNRPHRNLPVRERRPILKVESGEPWARARDAMELAEEKSCSEAGTDIRRAQQIVSDSNRVMLAFAAIVQWSCGERASARAILAKMKRHPEADDHGLRIAILHGRFGEPDPAFEWLARHRWTIGELATLRGDPMLDPLRLDPRFAELLVRIGVRGREPEQPRAAERTRHPGS